MTVESKTVGPIKLFHQRQAQWYWKPSVNISPISEQKEQVQKQEQEQEQAQEQKQEQEQEQVQEQKQEQEQEQWTKFSDIQSNIIEEAFNENPTPILVTLDHFTIDLKNSAAISKRGNNQKMQIKRIPIDQNQNTPLRKERFSLPLQINKPFNEWTSGGYWFIHQWKEKQQYISYTDIVEQAANGIVLEGEHENEPSEARYIAKQLRNVQNTAEIDIHECSIKLYTFDSFLYRLVNKTLRDNDKTKIDTLGPGCQ